ncbi:hypothetical protein K370107A2_16870 [Merdimmobilis hominis]
MFGWKDKAPLLPKEQRGFIALSAVEGFAPKWIQWASHSRPKLGVQPAGGRYVAAAFRVGRCKQSPLHPAQRERR